MGRAHDWLNGTRLGEESRRGGEGLSVRGLLGQSFALPRVWGCHALSIFWLGQ